MFQQRDNDGPTTALRGWLSDVFFPAITDRAHLKETQKALARRLGNRATLDEPLFGRSEGTLAIEAHIAKLSSWLLERGAIYERQHFTTGVDRDVTEGLVALSLEQKTFELPLAVIAEKRKSREVELRIYFATQPIKGIFVTRPPLVPTALDLPLPSNVATYVEALRIGDIASLLQSFEHDGALRDARGMVHAKGTGALKEFFDRLLAGGAFGGAECTRGGAADDGRRCALEHTLVTLRGRNVEPQACLTLFERGESGLFRQVRVYDDIDM
jgi:hypothetical protein